MSYWVIWFIAGFVLIIGEIFTASFFLSLIGIACLAAGLISLFTPVTLFFLPMLVFAVATLLLLFLLRPICIKYLYRKNAKSSNVDALQGKILIAKTQISNTNAGTVKLYADLWKAKTEDESVISPGETVRIERMEGNTLIVSKIDNQDENKNN